MTLYELTSQFAELMELASDPEVPSDVLADTIEGLEGDLEEKADGYAKVIRSMRADADSLKTEIKRLQDRKKALENGADRLTQALEYAMRSTGQTKLKTKLFSFGIQKNPASVDIEEGAFIPEEFLIQQEPQVNKKGLLEALKAGKKFAGISLKQTEGVRIR